MSWWSERGYPSFDEGKYGFPRTGQVIKHYRKQKKDDKGKVYTQRTLADILGISIRALRDIENKDAPLTTERRQFLCKLLCIPPALLGVRTMEEILSEQKPQPITVTTAKGGIDIEGHENYLESARYIHATTGRAVPIEQLEARKNSIYQELPHVRDNKPLQRLLCEYHKAIATLYRGQVQYDLSLHHMERAISFAKNIDDPELYALCLLNSGHTYSDAGSADKAVEFFDRILAMKPKLPDEFIGAFFLYSGPAYAKNARSKNDQSTALKQLDHGANIANSTTVNPHMLDLSIQRYHLNKASALINLGRPNSALEEINHVRGDRIWWTSYKDILTAQAYVKLGMYPVAVVAAEQGLVAVQKINSKVNIARVEAIHKQLAESSYKNSPDLARLEHQLKYT